MKGARDLLPMGKKVQSVKKILSKHCSLAVLHCCCARFSTHMY